MSVSNLTQLGSDHIYAVVDLLEQKVSALLEAARGQPFAAKVAKAREFYGISAIPAPQSQN